jgi:hypothetical protein
MDRIQTREQVTSRLALGTASASRAIATLAKWSLETALWDIAAGGDYHLLVTTPTTTGAIRALEIRPGDPERFAKAYARQVGVDYLTPSERTATANLLE